MTQQQLDAMQAAASSKRLAEFINRSAAQHLRAMRASWAGRYWAQRSTDAALDLLRRTDR